MSINSNQGGRIANKLALIRSYDDWSGTVKSFCLHHKLSTSSFYLWRKRLLNADRPAGSSFSQLKIHAISESRDDRISLLVRAQIELRFSPSVAPDYIASLTKALIDQ